MTDCNCNNDNFNTEPTSTPCVPLEPSIDCNRIRMFFGYHVKSGANNTNIIPGQLNRLYYTKSIDSDYIQKGFRIENYSAQELVDSGILPDGFGPNIDNTFELTEVELLASASYESWLNFLHAELTVLTVGTLITPNGPSAGVNGLSFGCWVLKALNFDLIGLQELGWKTYDAMTSGDTSGFLGWIQQLTTNPLRTGINQKPANANYPTTIDLDDCTDLDRAEKSEKLLLAYEWLKNIHDTYYGKQFLVRIGDPVPTGEPVSYPLDTICIKDGDGNYPSFDYPYFIDGDGSAQGYFLSDVIDSAGFPDANDKHIIGLSSLDWITDDNGKVGAFAKIGPYADSAIGTQCSGLYQQIKYPKFPGDPASSGDCTYWRMDISKINPESFYLNTSGISDIQNLYVSCAVSERFYVDNNGTWAHFTLSDKIPMVPTTTSNIQGFIVWDIVMRALGGYSSVKDTTTLLNLFQNPFSLTGSISSLLYIYSKFFPNIDIHGARSDTSLLNLAQTNTFCLIPEAVTIPFKSNMYTYGPFYYGDSNAGGVDVQFDKDIAPWNFIEHAKPSLPVDYAYNTMHNFGKDVAASAPRDLQKLEKGRITVAGLPCYCLSHWVDDKNCYDADNELGPTLLTDMSVEFNNGGFNTTYNFSTYTPRFGKPEKYITEAWKESIKDTQYLNKYLKTLEDQTDRGAQNYQLRLLNSSRIRQNFPSLDIYKGAKIQKDSTTHRIMFAGYEMLVNPDSDLDYSTYGSGEQYSNPSGNYPAPSDCAEYVCTTPTPITFAPPEYAPPPKRLYTFADTDKAYTSEYIQNTYHQLCGMSLDVFYLPVSLRGANKDPNIKEYEKYDKNSTTDTPNRFIIDGSGFLVPNGDWENNARVPRFAKRCENNGSFVEWDSVDAGLDKDKANDAGYPIPSKTRDEIPPFKLNGIENENKNCYALQINQKYLNPILSHKNLLGEQYYDNDNDKVDGWDDRKNESDKGFVVGSIVFGQDYIDYQLTHTSPENKKSDTDVHGYDDENTDEFIRQQFKNFRFPALRGPLVLQGWGYDTSGKPIPNSADGYGHAQMGEFRKHELTDKFMKNWLQYPKSWPVGPVDLRFDRERGVWTCPSPNKIVVARLKEKLFPNSSAKAELINPEADGIRFYEHYTISGPNGEDVKLHMEQTEITVYDFLGVELCQCDIVYAYYDDNRYIVLESDRAYKDPNDTCKDIVCTTTTTATTTTTPTTPTPPCDWCGLDCLKGLDTYNGGIEQVLGHDDQGCLKWFNISECPTPAPSPTP